MRIRADRGDLPNTWYNVVPDLGFPLAPLMSPSGYPLGRNDLASLAPFPVIEQELDSKTRDMPIPEEISRAYGDWRPTGLFRAERLEKSLDTPAHLFFKYEAGNVSGGHEMNTAVPQAYYASREPGVKMLTTATANGEWGASLAASCGRFGLSSKIFMVRSGYDMKPAGRYVMELLGAEVVASPSDTTRYGRKVLAENPSSPGSLSIALSEAFEYAQERDDAKFAWGTVMKHVLIHQSIIGLEARQQLQKVNARPDVIIGAVGGGSGFGGLILPFFKSHERRPRMVAVETASAPSLSRGQYAYDYGDASGLFALLKMYTLGHSFVPPGIRAGGMRYHGMSPVISALYREKQIEARTHTQREAFGAAVAFARSEGIIPSPECSYAVKAVIDEALSCKEKRQSENILFLLDANSNSDLLTLKEFIDGAITDQPFPDNEVQEALQSIPKMDLSGSDEQRIPPSTLS